MVADTPYVMDDGTRINRAAGYNYAPAGSPGSGVTVTPPKWTAYAKRLFRERNLAEIAIGFALKYPKGPVRDEAVREAVKRCRRLDARLRRAWLKGAH